ARTVDVAVVALRSDPTARRRLEVRVSMLKRRVGVASVLGFGALLGLVTQHAVGSQKHKVVRASQSATSPLPATSFFDANGPGYSFDDSSDRAAQQGSATRQSQQPPQAQQPVAQSGGS